MSEDDDLRRRQYVPLATHFVTGLTGSRILDEFGVEGLGVWTALLAAAKRSQIQGTIIWSSEADAWSQLGLGSHRPNFTFEDFTKLLGRIKQARTRLHGREQETTLTRFEDWNKTVRSLNEAKRKRRKRAQTTADGTADDMSPLGGTEGEGEGEYKSFKNPRPQGQIGSLPTPAANGKPGPRTDPDEHTCEWCGTRQRSRGELEDHMEYVHAANEWLRDNNPAAPLYDASDPYLTRET